STQVATAAANVRTAIQLLQTAGYTDIWLLSPIDGGMTPQAISGGFTTQATALSESYRDALYDQTDDLNIRWVDMFEFFHDIAPNFANSTQSCQVTSCGNPDTYLWWDITHPTEEAYRQVAVYLQGLR